MIEFPDNPDLLSVFASQAYEILSSHDIQAVDRACVTLTIPLGVPGAKKVLALAQELAHESLLGGLVTTSRKYVPGSEAKLKQATRDLYEQGFPGEFDEIMLKMAIEQDKLNTAARIKAVGRGMNSSSLIGQLTKAALSSGVLSKLAPHDRIRLANKTDAQINTGEQILDYKRLA